MKNTFQPSIPTRPGFHITTQTRHHYNSSGRSSTIENHDNERGFMAGPLGNQQPSYVGIRGGSFLNGIYEHTAPRHQAFQATGTHFGGIPIAGSSFGNVGMTSEDLRRAITMK